MIKDGKLYQPVYETEHKGVFDLHPHAYADMAQAGKIAESEAGKNGQFFVNTIYINNA